MGWKQEGKRVLRGYYGGYCNQARQKGEKPMSFTEFKDWYMKKIKEE